jgi:hypothetical protein
MKTLKTLLSLILILLTGSITKAQDIDSKRMNRDIRILESVLSESFKTGPIRSMNAENAFVSSVESSSVKGTYLPGYGVIFMVPHPKQFGRIVIRSSSDNAEEEENVVNGYTFYYGDEGDEVINKENVVARILEFLRDYAATIGQLKDDENLMVIYGANATKSRSPLFVINGAARTEKPHEDLPVISASASKKNIRDYRAGKLSEADFNKRVSVSLTDKKPDQNLDLKVLGNIFETALEEGDGYEFHITRRGALSYLYLENFGALYTIDVHLGHGRLNAYTIYNSVVAGRKVAVERENGEQRVRVGKLLEETENNAEKREETIQKEYDTLLTKMREFIVDYARTLSTVKSDQFLLVTLNITDRLKDVPDRVDFQIKKSVLENLDRGNISREEALKAVTVREF